MEYRKSHRFILLLIPFLLSACSPGPKVKLAENFTLVLNDEGETASFEYAILVNDRYDTGFYNLVAMNSEEELQAYVNKAVRLGAPPIPDVPFVSILILPDQSGDPEFKGHWKFQADYHVRDEKHSVIAGVHPVGKKIHG